MKEFRISHANRADGTPAFEAVMTVENNLRGNIATLITITAHPGNRNWSLLEVQEEILAHALQQVQSELQLVQTARRQIEDAAAEKARTKG